MEQRHGEVAATVRPQSVPLGEHGTDEQHPALGAPTGLWPPRCAGCENEIAERFCADASGVGEGGHRPFRMGVGVHHHDTRIGRRGDPDTRPEVQPFDEAEISAVGHQQLAPGVGELLSQCLTAVRGVRAHHHRSGERARPQPPHVLGHVVEEQGDVRRTRLAQLCPQGGTAQRVVHDLAPGPLEVIESQPRIGVARPSQQGLGNRPHLASSSHVRSRLTPPLRRRCRPDRALLGPPSWVICNMRYAAPGTASRIQGRDRRGLRRDSPGAL